MYLYSYCNKSESAIKLKTALGISMINHERSVFKGDPKKVVLNWGCSDLPREVRKCTVINNENSVSFAINKRIALDMISGHCEEHNPEWSSIPHTVDAATAIRWAREGRRVYCRGRLSGCDGAGLIVYEHNRGADHLDNLPPAKMYTKGVNAVKEYRVNIYKGAILGVQRKVPLDNHANPNPLIKTTGGGYGFKLVTLNIPAQVITCAKDCVKALGLDFGGVDVIWDGRVAWFLEVNTAPQLTPALVTAFSNKIKQEFNLNNGKQQERE